MRLLVAFVVWVAAAAGAAALSVKVAHSIHPTIDATAITASDRQSMFHTGPLTNALATIRSHIGANTRIQQAVIYPGYVDLTADRGASQIDAILYVGGRYVEDDSGTATSGATTFAWEELDPSAPASIAARLATVNHVPESQLHYMIFEADPISNKVQWLIYPQTGSYFTYSAGSGRSQPSVPATPTAPFDASSVKAADSNSLLVGSNFARALAIEQHHAGRKANSDRVVIYPGYAVFEILGKGLQTEDTVQANGNLIAAPGAPLSGSTQAFYLSQLAANGPAKLGRRIAAGAHLPLSAMRYAIVQTDPTSRTFYWLYYTSVGGRYFRATGPSSTITELGGTQPVTIR